MSVIPDIPSPDRAAAWQAAQALQREGHILAALQALHGALGDIFRLPLPGFQSVALAGPEANRFLLTEARDSFRWRSEGDPVTRLLRQGILVTDGALHDELRRIMTPALHRSLFDGFVQGMWRYSDRIIHTWQDGARIDLFTEMRHIALLIVMDALFSEDFGPSLDALWPAILRTIRYISPGPWVVWPTIPRPGYRWALQRMDKYFYRLIAQRRARLEPGADVLGRLIASGMSDSLIRDQLLTMFIAGHDTSAALLAWCLYLFVLYPDSLARAQAEVDAIIGTQLPSVAHARQLSYLDSVIKEALRLYPPIHLGSRRAVTDVSFREFRIPAGTRVLYSIYLTHRDKTYWPNPDMFDPDRFALERAHERAAYTFVPFGGGPRNCIGAAFAQVEAKIVLARILQQCEFRFVGGNVRPRMAATLEPHPGIQVEVHRRPERPEMLAH